MARRRHLIRDQVPDSDGHTMPPDTMAGSYELRDLDHATVGFLYEGKLVIDKTYGNASYGCGTCCGLTVAELIPDPFDGPTGIDYTEVMQSTEQCGGQIVDLADDGFNWQSSDPSVATLPTKVLHTVAAGSATGSGEVTVQNTHPAPRCPQITYGPTQPVAVCDFTIAPKSGTAQDCTKGKMNSLSFNAILSPVNPTSCTIVTSKSSCAKTSSTGAIELVVGTPECTDTLGGLGATAQYFAGPPPKSGSVGTITQGFTVNFGTAGNVSHSVTAPIECPD